MKVLLVAFSAVLVLLPAHPSPAVAVYGHSSPQYIVANTRPPDAYLALRTQPSSTAGRRIRAMPNGTLLKVLQRRADGWWYVKMSETGEEGWALSGRGNRSWIVTLEDNDQDPTQERDEVCRGILTVNRTEQTPNNTPDDGTRLIRADDITASCLFGRDSMVGRVILNRCRMGFACEVKARVNGDSSDVYYIKRVYSAKWID